MSFHFPCFRFDEVDQSPDRPGIYAWYHEVRITSAEVDRFVERVQSLSPDDRREHVESYLRQRVFEPYKESPYAVDLKGALKPAYGGKIAHQPHISEATIDALVESPQGIREIRDLLHRMVPVFSSPIYIGVATRSLRIRLLQHQKMLAEYRESPVSNPPTDESHSFAYDAVCERGLSPHDLIVYTLETPVSKKMQLVAEYIFNRLNYPLCGRR